MSVADLTEQVSKLSLDRTVSDDKETCDWLSDISRKIADDMSRFTLKNPLMVEYVKKKTEIKEKSTGAKWWRGVTLEPQKTHVCSICIKDNQTYFACKDKTKWKPKCTVLCIWFEWHNNIRIASV